MAYATLAELEALISKSILIELTDDQEIGQIDDSVVAIHMSNAEAEVNSALASAGYTVPVAEPIPTAAAIVKTATLWLTVCGISARRGVIPQDYASTCAFWRDKLDEIAKGEFELPLPTGLLNLPHSTTKDQEKIFTRSKYDTDAGDLRNDGEEHSLDVI